MLLPYLCIHPEDRKNEILWECQGFTISSGSYSDWKDATVGFHNYEKSATHKLAVEVVLTLSQTHKDIGEMLSINHAS